MLRFRQFRVAFAVDVDQIFRTPFNLPRFLFTHRKQYKKGIEYKGIEIRGVNLECVKVVAGVEHIINRSSIPVPQIVTSIMIPTAYF